MSLWVDELVSLELVSWWVDKLTGSWVCKLMSRRIRELLGFHEFIRQWVDLYCTLYMRGVFILCWYHKDNKFLSIYRNIKSQDDFALCSLCSYVKNTCIYVKTRNESLQTSLHPRVRAYHIIYLVVEIIGFKLLSIVASMFALLFRGTSGRHEFINF